MTYIAKHSIHQHTIMGRVKYIPPQPRGDGGFWKPRWVIVTMGRRATGDYRPVFVKITGRALKVGRYQWGYRTRTYHADYAPAWVAPIVNELGRIFDNEY